MDGGRLSKRFTDSLVPVEDRSSNRLPDWLAAAVVFVAAGAVLVLEVVGLRLVGPYLGVTLQTSSAVIGVSLAAIAYGAWVGGQAADRIPPRRLLGPAFVLAAAATALTLPVVRWAGELLRGSAIGGILTLAALAVFVPAALLSAIAPIVVKLQLADVRHTGRVVGKLSGIGTLGGITATLGTGFVLVAALPTSIILIGLAALLALAGFSLSVYQVGRLALSGPGFGIVLIFVAGGSLSVTAPNPCDVETAYHCARVSTDPARPAGRILTLNSARHSYVDLNDPRHLEFAYTQWIGAVVDVLTRSGTPMQAVHIGGGGFTLPRYVQATRPGSVSRVLELDGGLVKLDESRLGVVPSATLQVVVGDARVSLAREPSGSADIVIGDAFGHLAVPWHLTTREFVSDIRRVLHPGGAYAVNIIDYPPDRMVRAELATVAAVFPYVALMAPPSAIASAGRSGGAGSNFVIVGSDAPLPLAALRTRLDGLPAAVSLLDGSSFAGGARILTDDFAPVDQLLQ
jgi:MFS family permease